MVITLEAQDRNNRVRVTEIEKLQEKQVWIKSGL